MLGQASCWGAVMILVSFFALCHQVSSFLPAVEKPPNIVLLLMDDVGYGDLGVNNKHVHETPHIDALASSGMLFTDMHAAFSVCTPSRAALLTGRLAPRTGVFGNFAPASSFGMSLDEITMADMLLNSNKQGSGAQYKNHMIGKWHLGHNKGFSPTFRGFSTWYGLPYSSDMGCIDTTPQGCRPWYDRSIGQPSCPALCPLQEKDGFSGSCLVSGSPFTAIPLYNSTAPNCSGQASCNDDIVFQPFDPFQLNSQYTTRATAVLHDHAYSSPDSDTDTDTDTDPLFLYVAYSHMHSPMAYDAQFEGKSSRPGYQKIFGNMLAELDHSVGEIIKTLDETGLRNNTLVFLTSDNGPADLGKVSCDDIGSVGQFSGLWQRGAGGGGSTAKATVWEGGHRVVGVASWPGKIAAGVVSTELVSTVDLMPTMAALAGLELPVDRVYDGIDLSPILFDHRHLRQEEVSNSAAEDDNGTCAPSATEGELHVPLRTARRTLFHPSGLGGLSDIRDVPAMRLGKYEAFFGTSSEDGCFLADGSHRDGGGVPFTPHDPPLVFDLSVDPHELFPLDPGHLPAGLLQDLDRAYNAFWDNVRATFQSNTSYAQNFADRPCANAKSCCCRKEM